MNNKITEQASLYENLEQQSTFWLLDKMNQEDQKVSLAVQQAIPQIEKLIDAAYERLAKGGRLFYIGSGTSGRLGILDASECPPTFGVSPDLVIGVIAGGDHAIRNAVEFAEDDPRQGWKDLLTYQIDAQDILVGITASGTAPYVLGAVQDAKAAGILTGGITCNPNAALSDLVDYPIEAIVGPEFVTGSTRMKSGTAQKLILNMISTSLMIKLGHVKGNRMVDMQLSNQKLVLRGTRMIAEALNLESDHAKDLLLKYGSVRKALKKYKEDHI